MSDLDRLLGQADRLPAPELWPDIQAREPNRRDLSTGRRLLVAAVALPVAAAGIVLAATAFLGSTPVPRTAAPPVEPVVSTRVPLGSWGAAVALGDGSVWASLPQAEVDEECGGLIQRIDPDTNQITASIPVHGWPEDMAFGGGALWAEGSLCGPGNDPALFRIDPAEEAVTGTIPLDQRAADVAYGEESVWVTSSHVDTRVDEWEGRLFRIDPLSHQVIAAIPISGDPRDVVVAEGHVWVLNITKPGESSSLSGLELLRIDPARNSVDLAIPDVMSVGVGAGTVWTPAWLTRDEEGMLRFDPSSGQPVGEPIPGGFAGFAGEHGTLGTLVVGEGGAWGKATQSDGRRWDICRLNAQTLEVDGCVRPDRQGAWVDAVLDPEGHVLWVMDNGRSVIRIDLRPDGAVGQDEEAPPTLHLAAETEVGSSPGDLVVGEGAVWVSVSEFDHGRDDAFIRRLDPASGRIEAIIPVAEAGNLAVGHGSVWMLDRTGGPGLLHRIDPATDRIAGTVTLGEYVIDVAAGRRWLWVTRDIDSRSGELLKIDPSSLSVVGRTPLEGRIQSISVAPSGIWVIDSTSTLRVSPSLIHVDPETGRILGRVGGLAGLDVAVDGATIWVPGWLSTYNPTVGTGSGDRPVVMRIGADSHELVEPPVPLDWFYPFEVGPEGIWFLGRQGGSATVSLLDPQTAEMIASERIDDFAIDSSVHADVDDDRGEIWIANYRDTVTKVEMG